VRGERAVFGWILVTTVGTQLHESLDMNVQCLQLTVALNPSPVDGTTISFSAFSWVVRPPGQDARSQARKKRVSRKPEIKMGLLTRTLSCWQAVVGQLGAISGAIRPVAQRPNMSLDMRLLTTVVRQQIRTGPNPWLLGLSDPLD
jgi:hypothetical protein